MADGNMDPREAAQAAGAEMYAFAAKLFPVCRSITGDGVRATLDQIGALVPLERHEVPSGTAVLDWVVPKEWNIRAASIRDMSGRTLVDLRDSSLHVVGYSMPVKARFTRAELEPHLHSLPASPDLIPYRTSYYKPEWGFCLSERQRQALGEGPFDITIDATLSDGALSYGEFLKRGACEDEVLLAAHTCHPSLANDNCSGIALLTHLARDLAKRPTRLSYRFLFAPGTIGAITWLARNHDKVDRIKHGLIISNVGDGGGPTYKRSRRGSAAIDRAAELVLGQSELASPRVVDFSPYGYDERQYCSPGFNLPVGSLQRSSWGQFPEYHTSADNLDFIRPEHLASSRRLVDDIIEVLESNRAYRNLKPYGEPPLGKYGLFDVRHATAKEAEAYRMALLWVLNLSDGDWDLASIAARAKLPYRAIREAADRLMQAQLLEPMPLEPGFR